MDIRKDIWVNGALYLAASVGAILAQAKGWHTLEYVCKPMMMLVLSSWFFFNSRRVGDRFTLLIQAGLFFSFVGDAALMFQHRDEFMFMIGLAAFLLANLCYMIAFAINVFDIGGTDGALVSTALSIIILVGAVVFVLDLVGSLNVEETLRAPIVFYAIAITSMGIFAALRYRRTFDRSFWTIFIGAVLFMLSDALLAIRKFNLHPFEFDPIWVMVTYAVAQFLITGGALLHVLDPEMIRRRNALNA